MVEQAMTYLDELKGEDKLALIKSLREVTEGKVGCFMKVHILDHPNAMRI